MLCTSRESQRLFPVEKSLSRSHSSPQDQNKLMYFSSCKKSTRCILIRLLLAKVSQGTVGGISTTTAEIAFFVRGVAKQNDVILTLRMRLWAFLLFSLIWLDNNDRFHEEAPIPRSYSRRIKSEFIIWLAPWAGKMNRTLRSDWLTERERWSPLGSTRRVPESHIINALLTRLVRSR